MLKNRSGIRLFVLGAFLLLATGSVYAQQKKGASTKQTAQEINFREKKWNDVKAEAKKSGKLIFVDAYTSWCAPCRLLKSTTFKDPAAVAYFNQHFINYSIDMEKGEGEDLAEEWKIRAYPTLMFMNADGKILSTQIGYVKAERLLEFGKSAEAAK